MCCLRPAGRPLLARGCPTPDRAGESRPDTSRSNPADRGRRGAGRSGDLRVEAANPGREPGQDLLADLVGDDLGLARLDSIQRDPRDIGRVGFRDRLGVAADILSDRLATLVEYGVMAREPYREPGARSRFAYRLTPVHVGYLDDNGREVPLADEAIIPASGPSSTAS
jgi:hypothetical protein